MGVRGRCSSVGSGVDVRSVVDVALVGCARVCVPSSRVGVAVRPLKRHWSEVWRCCGRAAWRYVGVLVVAFVCGASVEFWCRVVLCVWVSGGGRGFVVVRVVGRRVSVALPHLVLAAMSDQHRCRCWWLSRVGHKQSSKVLFEVVPLLCPLCWVESLSRWPSVVVSVCLVWCVGRLVPAVGPVGRRASVSLRWLWFVGRRVSGRQLCSAGVA